MSVLFQILLGSGILIGCTLLHIAIIVWLSRALQARGTALRDVSMRHTFSVASSVVFVLLISHTVHIYVWAIALWLLGALPGYEEPIYFALVTYTTTGYGDLVIGPAFRTFAAMASANGILAFGLTTAFLVALIPRVFITLDE